MPNRTVDDIQAGLGDSRAAGDTVRGGTMEQVDRAFGSTLDQSHTTGSVHGNRVVSEQGQQQDLKAGDEMLARHQQFKRNKGTRQQVPSTRPLVAAQNYDEAPPGQPGPDYSAGASTKPAFTRGPSVIDYTAVTSAAPTPAGEVPNPMGAVMSKGVTRQRESHLPDLDIRDADVYGNGTFKEPDDEIRGDDEFGPELSRQETERGRRDTTTTWEGWTGA